jgi:putative endonuclease
VISPSASISTRLAPAVASKKYGVNQFVHVEFLSDVHEAIAREKAIKKWRRAWKLQLIERDNPEWHDLSAELLR